MDDDRDDYDEGRAPICAHCGVTALPQQISSVLEPTFVCDNEDCEAYGQEVS